MNIIKTLAIMIIATSSVSMAAQEVINLPAPSRKGGLDITESLWNRHSNREFSTRELSEQDLSDLLFAACGVNRPESGKITSPTAMNKQEIDVYVFSSDGVYIYDAKNNQLQQKAAGDYRSLIAGGNGFSQDFVLEAPVSLLMVANPQKFERIDDRTAMMAALDAGIAAENVCLFCAGRGLNVVPRASMDHDGIIKLLDLPAEAIVAINTPVGYPK